MTYQPVWGPARLVSVAQNERCARACLSKLSSFGTWQAVRGWITPTIGRLVVPTTLSAEPDWHRQLRNDLFKVEARRLL